MKRIVPIAAAVALTAATFVAFGQKADAPSKTDMTDVFTASSNRGFQPALEEAIAEGMKAHAGVADAMIEWELVKVCGKQGGIAGFHETSVTIRVTSGTPGKPK